MTPPVKNRCAWVPADDDLYRAYHDEEWGTPLKDDRALFELLILETFQAGLSWRLILGRREAFRAVFNAFNPEVIAAWTDAHIEHLLRDPTIIRNRQKLEAARANARAFLKIRKEHGTFSDWLWNYVDFTPVTGRWAEPGEVPASTPLSRTISRDMKKLGFSFTGPVTVYSLLQAAGLVQDHLVSCYRYAELTRS